VSTNVIGVTHVGELGDLLHNYWTGI